MKPILSASARPVLDGAARNQALLVFDFDGTLAPIVPKPRDAVLASSTRALLRALSLLYRVAVLSGRARADVLGRVAGIPLVAVVGNHGAEAGLGPVDRTQRARILAWRRHLSEQLRGVDGIQIEDKNFSLAVHYRAARARALARRMVLRATEGLERARVFGGRAVVNVMPEDAPHKGTAIQELRARTGTHHVVYVGDDATDEDAFRSGCVEIGIKVGRTSKSHAEYYIASQPEIDELLRALLCARLRLDGRGEECEGLMRAVVR